MDYNELVTR